MLLEIKTQNKNWRKRLLVLPMDGNLEGKGSSNGGIRILEDINDKFSIKKINYLIYFIFA